MQLKVPRKPSKFTWAKIFFVKLQIGIRLANYFIMIFKILDVKTFYKLNWTLSHCTKTRFSKYLSTMLSNFADRFESTSFIVLLFCALTSSGQ